MAILLSGTGLAGIALAQQEQVYTGMGWFMPDMTPDPVTPIVTPTIRQIYPEVTIAYGVGLNKITMETEPVGFIELRYSDIETIEVLPGDINGDCTVDSEDLNLFQASYGKSRGEQGYNPSADLNGDYKVDYKDLLILARNYGKSCPAPSPPAQKTITYLIVGSDLYKITKTYEKYDWDTRTKIYKYRAEDGTIMTAIVQHNPEGTVSVAAEFGEYLITFQPMYKYGPRIAEEQPVIASGLMETLSEEIDINIQGISSGQIKEWLE